MWKLEYPDEIRMYFDDCPNKEKQDKYFNDLIKKSIGKSCLSIGRQENVEYHSDFKFLDPFDTVNKIDYPLALGDIESSPDYYGLYDNFDLIIVRAVMEHVENPIDAAGDLACMTKTGGEVYIDFPFSFPYHPYNKEYSYKDFWRFTPDSINMLMKRRFNTIKLEQTVAGSFIYHGRRK